MKSIKILLGSLIVLTIVTIIAVNARASEDTLLPPSLTFQADIYGDSNLETIYYNSNLAFYDYGGFGRNAHIFASGLASGDQIAYAVSVNTPNVFLFEIMNAAGQILKIGMPNSAYPLGSVEAISETELHFVWEINDPNMHINLHRYARLIDKPELVTGHCVEERFIIENLGADFTLMKFSEYLHMDDRARLRDIDADGKEETLLAINSYSTTGYPVFGKIYIQNEELLSEFISDGIYATITHQHNQSIPTNTYTDISRATYISATEKSSLGAESQIAADACIILGCNSIPTRWYLRSYRTDDASAMFVNGLMVVGSRYSIYPDSGWIDVNRYWKQDSDNYLSVASFDTGACCSSTWGFALRRDETTIFDLPGSASTHLGLVYTNIYKVSSDGLYEEDPQELPGTQLDGTWTVELRVNQGIGFVLVENLPVLGSMNNLTQTRDISSLLGQQENHINLNIWGDQSGTLEWSFTIKNGETVMWQNQMTVENAPRARIHHMMLAIDANGIVYPKYDYPADYRDRTRGSVTNMESAFNIRTTSLFDHELPIPLSFDSYMLPYIGGEPGYNPYNYRICTLPYCYDSHNGYDVGHTCVAGSVCINPLAVYPVADGMIIQTETGWINQSLGCQVAIDHGNGWKTIYAHLLTRDPESLHICIGILKTQGHVTRFDQIGIMGCSGDGCAPATPGGADPIHLHFEAKHLVSEAYRAVDPSGWVPINMADPWANYTSGATSYPQWFHLESLVQVVDPTVGGQLLAPDNSVMVTVPTDYFSTPLTFYLSNVPASDPNSQLINSGISFSLSAWDSQGIEISQLEQDIELQVSFNLLHVNGLVPATLAIYTFDETLSHWVMLPTTVDWENQIASTQIDHLSIFALMAEESNKIFIPFIYR